MSRDTESIYNRLNSMGQYHPGTVTGWSDWTTQAGDIITVEADDGPYKMPVYNFSMVWNGSPTTTIESTGNEKRDEISKKTRSSRSGYSRATEQTQTNTTFQTEYNKTDQHLELLAKKLNKDQEVENWSNFTITADAITSLVGDGNGLLSCINQSSTTITLSAERIDTNGLFTAIKSQIQELWTDEISTNLVDTTGLTVGEDGATIEGLVVMKGAFDGVPKVLGSDSKEHPLQTQEHAHVVEVADDGTVTLKEATDVGATGTSFNIADTKAYETLVSAIVEGFGKKSTSGKHYVSTDLVTKFNSGRSASTTIQLDAYVYSIGRNQGTQYDETTHQYTIPLIATYNDGETDTTQTVTLIATEAYKQGFDEVGLTSVTAGTATFNKTDKKIYFTATATLDNSVTDTVDMSVSGAAAWESGRDSVGLSRIERNQGTQYDEDTHQYTIPLIGTLTTGETDTTQSITLLASQAYKQGLEQGGSTVDDIDITATPVLESKVLTITIAAKAMSGETAILEKSVEKTATWTPATMKIGSETKQAGWSSSNTYYTLSATESMSYLSCTGTGSQTKTITVTAPGVLYYKFVSGATSPSLKLTWGVIANSYKGITVNDASLTWN